MKIMKVTVPAKHHEYFVCKSQEDVDMLKKKDIPFIESVFKKKSIIREVDYFKLEINDNGILPVFLLFWYMKGFHYQCKYAIENEIPFVFNTFVENSEDIKKDFQMNCNLICVPHQSYFEEWYSFLELFVNLPPLKVFTPTQNQKQNRIPIKPKDRITVFERDNYTCQICGRTVEDGVKLEIDHRFPVAHGGTNDLDNLQTLCKECNIGKGARLDLKCCKK